MHQRIPSRLLRRRKRADTLQWIIYAILWGAIVCFGMWIGLRLGSVRIGLMSGLGVIVVCLFYAIVCLSWHACSLVDKEQSETDVARVKRLLTPICKSADIRMPRVFILRTLAANAFAAGVLSRMRSIGVTRGALDMLDDHELQAVLAHEVTHLQRRDSLFDGWWIALTGLVIFISAISVSFGIAALQSRSTDHDDKEGGSGAVLGIFLIVGGFVFGIVAILIIQLLLHHIMRRCEYRADEGAVFLIGSAKPLIRALRKLEFSEPMLDHHTALAMLFSLDPAPRRGWLDALFSTHPRMSRRIQRLQGLSKELGEPIT
ncbi:M48 family metalloprotease [Alicyclobacillus fodiniaquatilis]|uniref:M48 family metalloprotease n=1 Tax=Alicyclobacillus fodiniaquatilis TaxID=1661150 RepID=A0ABW4JM59_9BACL